MNFPDPDQDQDPDTLPRHQDYTVTLFIDPTKVAAGLLEQKTSVFGTAVAAYHELRSIIEDNKATYKSFEDLVATAGGFQMAAFWHLKGVGIPVRAWLLKQTYVHSVTIGDSSDTDGAIALDITFQSIIEEKGDTATPHWSSDLPPYS